MSNTFGNCDLSTITTTVDKVMLTDAELDILWSETNQKRLFTHQAHSPFNSEGTVDASNPHYTDDISEAKLKVKTYISDFLSGVIQQTFGCDAYIVRTFDGSTIIGFQLMHSIKGESDTYVMTADSIPDLNTLWAQEVGSGDWRDECVAMDTVMYNPMLDGTSSSIWASSLHISDAFLIAIHTAIKADGYKNVLHCATGLKQKQYFNAIRDMMKNWEENGGFPAGHPSAGVVMNATPVFNYVEDNTTPAYQLGCSQFGPAYINRFPNNIKPCAWPFTTTKVGGIYPPYA
jgi:hypothetical protein